MREAPMRHAVVPLLLVALVVGCQASATTTDDGNAATATGDTASQSDA